MEPNQSYTPIPQLTPCLSVMSPMIAAKAKFAPQHSNHVNIPININVRILRTRAVDRTPFGSIPIGAFAPSGYIQILLFPPCTPKTHYASLANHPQTHFPITSASSVLGTMYGWILSLILVFCSKAYASPMSVVSVNFGPRKLIPKL